MKYLFPTGKFGNLYFEGKSNEDTIGYAWIGMYKFSSP
jgi:hypothetical protein